MSRSHPLACEHTLAAERSLTWAILVASLVAAAFTFSLLKTEPDLWGHVQYGRDALREGLHRTTTYSYTANGYRWINHENLSELLFAWCVDHLGVWSLLAGKCLLGVTVASAVLWRAVRRGVSPLVACGGMLLMCANLIGFWHTRPQILSYVMFAGLLSLLSFSFAGWQERWTLPFARRFGRGTSQNDGSPAPSVDARRLTCLFAAAILFAVWINTHGAFLAGLAVFEVYLAVRVVEIWLQPGPKIWLQPGPIVATPRSVCWKLIAAGTVAAAATLLNPYGIEIHRWLLQSLTIPRPEIVEWHALRPGDEPFLAFVALVSATGLGLLLSRRPLDATHTIVLGLILWQAISHQRHVPFLAIACGFWMMPHWQSVVERWQGTRSGEQQLSPTVARWAARGLLATSLCITAWLVTRCVELPVERSEYPVAAIEYAVAEKLDGRMVATYNWAQYAIAALGDPVRGDRAITVGFDGRFRTCYPLDLVDQHFDFILGFHPQMPRHRSENSPPPSAAAVLEREHPNLVLISRHQPHAVRVMENHANQWGLLYQDQLAQLWGRKTEYDDPASPRYIPHDRRKVSDQPQAGSVPWPAIPTSP